MFGEDHVHYTYHTHIHTLYTVVDDRFSLGKLVVLSSLCSSVFGEDHVHYTYHTHIHTLYTVVDR